MRYLLASFVILTIGFGPLKSQNFEICDIPEWVKEVENPSSSKVSKYDVSSGVYTSLYDHQINLGEEADFTHCIINILTHGGVTNASQIYISYDTSYQHLQFHYLYLWRNGQKIDRTNDLSLETISNETDLHAGIYTGLITAHDILEDVRKDDRLEYAYTIIGDNPIFNHKQYRLIPLESESPIDLFSMRILYPANEEFVYDCSACKNVKVKEEPLGNNVEIEIIKKDLEAIEVERTAPAWHIQYSYFVISSFKSWSDVNAWANGIFSIEKEQDLEQVFSELFLGEKTLEDSLNTIINFVQNDIRYMGIESGIGSIKPFPPEQVVQQRYGDCKDKSLLLVTMLKKIGIMNSYPALVNSSLLQGIENLLPGGHVFDHCIVYFEFENKPYWIDPSFSQLSDNFKVKMISDYGKALVVKENLPGLVDMNILDETSRTEIDEYFEIPSFTKPAKLKVVTKLYGLNADYMRNMLEYYSLKDISDEFKNYYVPLFPGITEDERLKVEDDTENNILTLTETYVMTDVWRDQEGTFIESRMFQYEPVSLYNYVAMLSCETKNQPIQVPFPSQFSQVTTISLPEPITLTGANNTTDNRAFFYNQSMEKINENTIRLSYSFKTKCKEVAPKEFEEICPQMNSLVRDLPLQISYPKKMVFNSR